MRTIKVRAWDKFNNTMHYNGFVLRFVDFTLKPVALWHGKRKPSITLMQFTGLLDKNGKEIFDGDILEFETAMAGRETIVVEYDKGYYPNFALFDSSEVIGNIYENPELLTL